MRDETIYWGDPHAEFYSNSNLEDEIKNYFFPGTIIEVNNPIIVYKTYLDKKLQIVGKLLGLITILSVVFHKGSYWIYVMGKGARGWILHSILKDFVIG